MALDSFNRPSGHINWTPLVTALQNLANSGGSSGGSSTVVRNTASANSATEAYSTEYLNGKINALETSDGTQNTAISALQTSDSNQNTKLDKFPLGQSPADDNKQLAWVSNSYQLVSPSSTTILNPTDPGNPPAGSPNEVYSTAYVNLVTNQVVANAININTLTDNQPGGLLLSTNPTATQISLVHANGAGVGVPVDLFSLNNAQTKDLLEYNAGNWVNSRAIQIDSVSAEQVTVRSADGSASFHFRQGTHGGIGNPGFVYSLPAINTLPPAGSVLQVESVLPSGTEAQLTWSTLSSGSSTFASLTDTAQYTSGDANKFVVLDNDGARLVYTDKIKLNGNNIEVYGQLNAGSQPVNGVGGVAIGDSTHKFTQIHVTTVNSTTVNSTSVTATGTVQANIVQGSSYMQTPRIDTEQITVGNYTYILPYLTNAPTVGGVMKVASVSNQVVNLEFSAAEIPNSKKVDQLTLSNGNLTAEDGTTVYSANGVLFGDRNYTMYVDNTLFKSRSENRRNGYVMINGYRRGGTWGGMENDMPYQMYRGGHFLCGTLETLYVKLNAIHIIAPSNDGTYLRLKLYGTNDRANFDLITTFDWNSGYHDGFQATTHTINGSQVTIPARGASDYNYTTYYVGTQLYSGTSGQFGGVDANGTFTNQCKRWVFDNTNFYRYYMIKYVDDSYSPNVYELGANVNNILEFEW